MHKISKLASQNLICSCDHRLKRQMNQTDTCLIKQAFCFDGCQNWFSFWFNIPTACLNKDLRVWDFIKKHSAILWHKMHTKTAPLKYYGSQWLPTLWLPTFLKKILFCVQQKKETHTGLEQHEGFIFIFGWTPFKGPLKCLEMCCFIHCWRNFHWNRKTWPEPLRSIKSQFPSIYNRFKI